MLSPVDRHFSLAVLATSMLFLNTLLSILTGKNNSKEVSRAVNMTTQCSIFI